MSKPWTAEELEAASKAMESLGFMGYEEFCKELVEQFGQQQASQHYPCPRCGEATMSENLWRNALSRNGNVCICNQCGAAEALEAFMGNPLPLSKWAVLQNPSAYAKRM